VLRYQHCIFKRRKRFAFPVIEEVMSMNFEKLVQMRYEQYLREKQKHS
jgi:hypothetical protein